MLTKNISSTWRLVVAVLLLVGVSAVNAQQQDNVEFVPIEQDDIPQDVIGVRLPSLFKHPDMEVADTMVTIEPSRDGRVQVLSHPANLVTAVSSKDDNLLTLHYHEQVATTTSSGGAGIRIRMPATHLTQLHACCHAKVQVLEGFSNLETIIGSSGATVKAAISFMTDNPDLATKPVVVATTQAHVAVSFWGGTIRKVTASDHASVTIIAEELEELSVSTNAVAQIEVDIPKTKGRVTTGGWVEISDNEGACQQYKVNNDDESSCLDGQQEDFTFSLGDSFTFVGTSNKKMSCATKEDAATAKAITTSGAFLNARTQVLSHAIIISVAMVAATASGIF